MTTAALITWLAAACGGLFMFAIWLIDYEHDKDGGPSSRLPAAVVFGHVLLAATGLVAWIGYLYGDDDRLALTSLITLAAVAVLGLTMLRRWISVYRDSTYSVSITVASTPGLAHDRGQGPRRTQLSAGRGRRARLVRGRNYRACAADRAGRRRRILTCRLPLLTVGRAAVREASEAVVWSSRTTQARRPARLARPARRPGRLARAARSSARGEALPPRRRLAVDLQETCRPDVVKPGTTASAH